MTTATAEITALSFFVADHAVSIDGRLFVNGGYWNRVLLPAFPHMLPPISVAGVFEIPFNAYHVDHNFVVGLRDADGQPLGFRVDGSFRVGAAVDLRYGDPSLVPFAVPVNGLLLHTPGDYTFTLSVGGRELTTYAFRAMQVAPPMQFTVGIPELPPQT